MNLARYRTLSDSISQAIVVIALFTTFALIAYSTLKGEITIGDLVMYFLAFQVGIGFIQAILSSMAGLYEDNLFLTNFYQFLDLEPQIRSPDNPIPVPTRSTRRSSSGMSVSLTRGGKRCACRGESCAQPWRGYCPCG